MKKHLLITVFVLLACFGTRGQEYKKIIENCLHYIATNDTALFKKEYPKLYTEYIKAHTPEYRNALKCIEDNDTTGAFDNIRQIIAEDYFFNEIREEKKFRTLHSSTTWKKIINLINSTEQTQNIPVKDELLKLQNTDQSIRLLLQETRKTNSPFYETIHREMKKIDNENIIRIQQIIDRFGWLGKKQVGTDGNEALFLCIQHVDDLKIQHKYLPLLKAAVKKGNAEPWHLAFLTDRVLMNKGEKQLYGTQYITSHDPSKSYLVPLQDPDNVDRLRAEVGLSSLKEDFENNRDSEWNLETYKQRLPEIEKMYKEYSKAQGHIK